METTVKSPVMIYTEQTPNPETLKFVTNKMLHDGIADFKDVEPAKEWSPLAVALFDFPFVKGVYICKNFVTLTKEFNYAWEDIMLQVKEYIKEYVTEEKEVVKPGYEEAQAEMQAQDTKANYSGDDAEIVMKIQELLNEYVKPQVEMDGGNIEFKSYKDGVVTVIMQGACSGCPSSTVTLKSGIEGMLSRMIPEVKEVVSEMG